MATAELVGDLIDAGKRLTSALDSAGIEVRTALWFYDTDAKEWRLFLAMPMVEERGPAGTYAEIGRVLRATSIPGLFLRQIAAVRPTDELIAALRKAIQTGRDLASIRLTNSAVDNILIEDAYIYRST
jgi:hypothetical protein